MQDIVHMLAQAMFYFDVNIAIIYDKLWNIFNEFQNYIVYDIIKINCVILRYKGWVFKWKV